MSDGNTTTEVVQALRLLQQIYIAASEYHNIELRDSLVNGSLQEVVEALGHSMDDLEQRNGHVLSGVQQRELSTYRTLHEYMEKLRVLLFEHAATLEDYAAREVLNGNVPLYLQ